MKSHIIANRHQRGSVIITTAIAMSLIVICLIGTELGYLFFLKRELQKTADLAALAGAQSIARTSCTKARLAAIENSKNTSGGNMPKGLDELEPGEVVCGNWKPANQASNPVSRFTPENSDPSAPSLFDLNAVQVSINRTPPSLISSFSGNRTITATAIATQALPQAQLKIRSTLLNVSSEASALNAVLGGFLGTTLDISAVGWQALASTNVNLLDYLVALGATAGNYESVLNAPISIGRIIKVATTVLEPGITADLKFALDNFSGAASMSALPEIRLGELLSIATGTPSSALNTSIQVFQLIQGSIQLASNKNAAVAGFTIPVPGVANVTARIQVIEPPQVSAIGNPDLITTTSTANDPNRIYVRTAQLRTHFSVDLSKQDSIVNSLQKILDNVTGALSPLASFLATTNLANLGDFVGRLIAGILPCSGEKCPISKELYADVLSNERIDVTLDAANGSAYIKQHLCTNSTTKSMDVQTATDLAKVRVGKISNVSDAIPNVNPVSIVEIGYRETRHESCGILSLGCRDQVWKTPSGTFSAVKSMAMKNVVAGLSLKLDVPLAESTKLLPYAAPAPENLPEIDAAPYSGGGADPSYSFIRSQSLVGSLSSSLAGITLTPYGSQSSGGIGPILVGTISLINVLLDALQAILRTLLSPLLDPTVNTLLDALGVSIAKTEVGARLSCSRGAELVY